MTINIIKYLHRGMLLGAATLISGTNGISAQTADNNWAKAPEVKTMTLKNGMTVWLNEDHSQPKAFGAVVVKAGANDCPDTGIAHYFEHILFKGTDKIGTTDYTAERPWLDSISAQYDKLATTTAPAERTRIQSHINELSVKAAQYAIPNEFNNLISKYGGSGLNAGTSYDFTMYYNTFVPQYITQWCELNSERLIAPVFRLFQGELETVYEEKNMYSDNIIMPALEKFMATAFAGTPYEYPIIGSTENLKNPRLSDMKAFYDKYYVAGNMALIICGDIKSDSLTPLLEKTFGRIRPGTAPVRRVVEPEPFDGKTTVGLKVPIPLIKAVGRCYRGPKVSDKDAVAVEMAVNLLMNEQQTGLLDSLTDAGKWLTGFAGAISNRDAGTIVVGAAPNIPFAKKKNAERLFLGRIERLKRGEFSEETLEHIKQEYLRDLLTDMENIGKRANMMISAYIETGSWAEYLKMKESVKDITKADIMRVANRYMNDNYVRMVKKFGVYKKDKVTQPGYKAVTPKNAGAESEYAKALDSIPAEPVSIRLVDFDNDVHRADIAPQVRLYTTPNPMNDIFTMRIKYHAGTMNDPKNEIVKSLINDIGTDSLTRTELGKALQRLGTTVSQDIGENALTIDIRGFDSQMEPSLRLLGHFMRHVKGEDKKLKDAKKEHKVAIKSFDKSSESIYDAVNEKVMYGGQSLYLKYMPGIDEVNRLSNDDILNAYTALQNTECDITYTGTLAADTVKELIVKYLPCNPKEKHKDLFREFMPVEKPVVYVYQMPKARQNIIGTYIRLPKAPAWDERAVARLWGEYFGGGMSSLMFQELREFRSFAYYAGGSTMLPAKNAHGHSPAAYIATMSTQTDKTLAALGVLDSLFNDMPVKEKTFKTAKQSCLNNINNSYPSFRGKAEYVAGHEFKGHDHDTNKEFSESIGKVTTDDIRKYYTDNVKQAPRAIIIVGKIDKAQMEALRKYGDVKLLTKKDIIKM